MTRRRWSRSCSPSAAAISTSVRAPDDDHTSCWPIPRATRSVVIEPWNKFLGDCDRFGSITCDGTQEVGYFWSEALGWPLVWDQDEETAIRAPDLNGPLITWGGPPVVAEADQEPLAPRHRAARRRGSGRRGRAPRRVRRDADRHRPGRRRLGGHGRPRRQRVLRPHSDGSSPASRDVEHHCDRLANLRERPLADVAADGEHSPWRDTRGDCWHCAADWTESDRCADQARGAPRSRTQLNRRGQRHDVHDRRRSIEDPLRRDEDGRMTESRPRDLPGLPRSRSTTSPEFGIEPGLLVLPQRLAQVDPDPILPKGADRQGHRVPDGGVQLGRQSLEVLVRRRVDPDTRTVHADQHTSPGHRAGAAGEDPRVPRLGVGVGFAAAGRPAPLRRDPAADRRRRRPAPRGATTAGTRRPSRAGRRSAGRCRSRRAAHRRGRSPAGRGRDASATDAPRRARAGRRACRRPTSSRGRGGSRGSPAHGGTRTARRRRTGLDTGARATSRRRRAPDGGGRRTASRCGGRPRPSARSGTSGPIATPRPRDRSSWTRSPSGTRPAHHVDPAAIVESHSLDHRFGGQPHRSRAHVADRTTGVRHVRLDGPDWAVRSGLVVVALLARKRSNSAARSSAVGSDASVRRSYSCSSIAT